MYLIPILAIALFAFPVLYPRWQKFQQQRRFAVDIANVRLIQGPRLIASEWEGDNTVTERAETLRGLLILSGNTWITPEQIIVRKYHPHGGDGKTVLTFEVWRGMVQGEFAQICARHYAATSVNFDAAVHGQRVN